MRSDNRSGLIGILAGIVLLSFSPIWSQTKVNPGFNLFSAEQDIEIGRQSAAEVEGQLPLLDDPTAQGLH